MNGTLFFQANDNVHSDELWKSNGTAAGTVLVKEIWPGHGSSPVELTNVNGTLVFAGNNGVHGNELWKSNGTAASTVLVKDVNPGEIGSDPKDFTVVGSQLFFTADNGLHGREVWVSPLLNTAGSVLRITDASKGEGNSGVTAFTFVVTLTPASPTPVTVNFATASGTAAASTDYTPVAGTLTFAPGQTSKVVTVNVVGDTTPEPNETFVVNLSTPVGATLFDGQGVGTILNDDGPVLRITDVSKAESNAGLNAFVFTVTLTPASANPVTVSYSTVNGSALAGSDYTAIPPTLLTFTPGQTSKIVTVNAIGDTTLEQNETFLVNLSGATGATVFKGQGIGIILNDEGAVLRITDVSKAEGNSGVTPFTFTVGLAPASASLVTVSYSTANGSALAGGDYTAIPPILLTFTPGQTSKAVTVNVVGETAPEPNETFLVNLSGAMGATLFKGRGVGTILNDDTEAAAQVVDDAGEALPDEKVEDDPEQ